MRSVLEGVWTPHPGQREFLENPAKIKVLACGRRWGKTDACAASIVEALHRASPTRHVLIAPTLDQARLLFERVVELLERSGKLGENGESGKKGKSGKKVKSVESGKSRADSPSRSSRSSHTSQAVPDHKIRRSPYPSLTYGIHKVIARSGHVGRSLRGNEATHLVIDEAAFVPEELITEVAMPMLATTDGHLTMISTPRGMNHFWRFYQMGVHGENGVWSRTAPSSESPHVRKEFLKIQKELISERAFRTEYGAEFMDPAGRVFRTDAIDDCLVTSLPREIRPPYFVGIDWAKFSDFSAVVVLSGTEEEAMVVEASHFNGLSWGEQVERVSLILSRYPGALVLCDKTGLGGPVLEMMQKRLPRVGIKGKTFTAPFKNELIQRLGWLVERRRLRMTPHPELIRELQHFEASETPAGGVRFGGIGGYHDDLVIALALAAWEMKGVGGRVPQLGRRREFGAGL